MPVRRRILLLVAAVLISMLAIAVISLSVLRANMISERQSQFGALVSFAFNVGIAAFSRSTLLARLNRGHYSAVPGELRRWAHANGKKLPGLVRRREAEIRLWES